ncbi:MAG: signal peptidase I [Planctomycetes bacterium]|nr:signal peptidase I [Planctomycetota bacterium]
MLFAFRGHGRSVPATTPAGGPSLATASARRGRRGSRFLLDALLGASLMILAHVFVIQVSVVKGHSMEPCLHDGDRLVVDRVSYSLGEVGRGDVVVLRYPKDPSVDFVKRVVGLPGDRVAMHGGMLTVNGSLADDYGCIVDAQELAEQEVPPGHVFVLGDNRPVSCDSREFGLVPHELLKGKVRVRFWPLANATVF